MPLEHAIAIAFLAFISTAGLLLIVAVLRGRSLCRQLAQRFPEQYDELGQPRPGFLNSTRRSAYMRFVMQRQFEQLGDARLSERFEQLRDTEMRHLAFLLTGFGVLGLAVLWLELVGRP